MKVAAFSLIEMSIVLLIVSLMAAGALTVGQSVNARSEYETTDEKLEAVVEALKYFYATNGRLPCPAARTLKLGDALYGKEILSGACNVTTAVTGVTRVETSTGSGVWVRIGVLPTRDLKLPDSLMRDDFDGRFTYAVMQTLTGSATFSANTGALTVNDGTGTNIATDAAFVVLSHGKDGKGATLLSGTAKDCGATANLDVENCDNDTIFTDTEFASGDVVATFFDDRIRWMNKTNFVVAANTLQTGGGWTDVPLTDTADFDVSCLYRANLSNPSSPGWIYAGMVMPTFLIFDVSIGSFHFGAIDSNAKSTWDLAVEGNINSRKSGPWTVQAIEKNCGGGGGGGALDVSWHTDTHAGGSAKSFVCPAGKKLLSARVLQIPSGDYVCGNTVNADNTGVSWGGCNVMSGQQYMLEASCGGGGGGGGGGGISSGLRVESGSLVVPDSCAGGTGTKVNYESAFFCTSGGPSKNITFATPFTSTPHIIVTPYVGADSSLLPCTGGVMDQVGSHYDKVTTTGFRAFAWMSPAATRCGAYANYSGPVRFNWLAVGQ